jgi:hypothetical protein
MRCVHFAAHNILTWISPTKCNAGDCRSLQLTYGACTVRGAITCDG